MTAPKFNPLIVIPSPRNVGKTKAALDTIPDNIDRLWVKFFKESEAYNIMQTYLLDHLEYSHMVICPDDLMVFRDHFDAIAATVRADPQGYPVHGGICNFDMGDPYIMCVSTVFPPCNPRRHITGYSYSFMNINDRRNPAPRGVTRVSFNGFPCMFISRKVLEVLNMRTDWEFNLQFRLPGSSVDTVFCWEAYHQKIDIYADFDVKMLHLRGWEDKSMAVLTGVEEPHVYLERKGEMIEQEPKQRPNPQIVPKVS